MRVIEANIIVCYSNTPIDNIADRGIGNAISHL
jgi:hypothetical protein